MAWMKSSATGKFYLTGEFTSRSDIPQAEASGISAVLGFATVEVPGANITAELNRVAANRAALIADITAAVIAALPPAQGGVVVVPTATEIAVAVNDEASKRLAG